MKCPVCGRATKSRLEEYRYAESGLTSLTLEGVLVRRCAGCGWHEVELQRVAELHDAVSKALAFHSPRLTPDEIRFMAGGEDGLESLKRLLVRMHVGRDNVERWVDGRCPCVQAERTLRALVQAAGHSLCGLEVLARRRLSHSKARATRLRARLVRGRWVVDKPRRSRG